MAVAFLYAARAAGISLNIIETLRSRKDQDHYLAIGTSWRKDSLHLRGLAIDVAPLELLKLKNWAPAHPLWARLGEIGESAGLRWGGRWKGKRCDQPHFECPAEMERRLGAV